MAAPRLSPGISPLTYYTAYAPFNLINPDNARILRITAAAGTELADAYSYSTFITGHDPYVTPVQKQFTTTRAVILHAAWLVQACTH